MVGGEGRERPPAGPTRAMPETPPESTGRPDVHCFLFLLLLLVLAPGRDDAPSADLLDAARRGALETIARLLDESEDAVRQHDERNCTALHFAAAGGHLEAVELLLGAGAELEAADVDGDTPLLWAAHAGHVEVAAMLHDAGANPTPPNQARRNLLHFAILGGNREMIELALFGDLDVDARDFEGNTALHLATLRNRRDLATMLIEGNAATEEKENYGRTPLLLVARESGDVGMARLLIDNGANIEARDRFGDTPLILATWRGYSAVIELLLERGAEVPTTGPQGRAMTIDAAKRGQAALFAVLVEKGADLSIRNEEGGSLLHSACDGGSMEVAALLLGQGLPIDEQDRYGRTPLHYAAERGRREVVELLLEREANPNAASLSGITPYDDARLADHRSITELLLEAGADQGEPSFPKLEGPYLGQTPPGLEPQLFAPDIVASHRFEHGSVSFSPDGREAYWSTSFMLGNAGYSTSRLYAARQREGRWMPPHRPDFAADLPTGDDVPFMSSDGKKLYFISRRTDPRGGGRTGERVWFVERTCDGWSEAELVDGGPNTIGLHWVFSVAATGVLYCGTSAPGGLGMGDIYRCAPEGGGFGAPVNLGAPVNTEASEGSPFIAPDESYLILVRNGHAGGLGSSDLFVSFRDGENRWREPVLLPAPINTESHEQCPFVSHDGKYLFFNSHRNGNADVYWVDAAVILQIGPH